jgi:hypothetical protein
MKKSLREFAKAQEAAQPDIFSAEAVAPKHALLHPRNIIISVILLLALAVGGYFLWVELTKTPQERMTESLTSHGVVLNEVHTTDSILQQCFATEKKIGRIIEKVEPPERITVLGMLNGKQSLLDLECNKDSKTSIKSVTESTGPAKQG